MPQPDNRTVLLFKSRAEYYAEIYENTQSLQPFAGQRKKKFSCWNGNWNSSVYHRTVFALLFNR